MRALGNRLHTITKKHNECVLHESYTTPTAGESFNIYDRARGVWHQTWVDVGGLLLQLDGGMQGDTMVLEGPGTWSTAFDGIYKRVDGGDDPSPVH